MMIIRQFLLIASLFVLLIAGGAPRAFADTFVFSAIPDQDAARLRERFDKVGAYLSKALGVETKYMPVKSYAAAVSAFRNNQIQLAWFGGLSGVRARNLVPGSQAIAQGYEDRRFVTYFIAHSSTKLTLTSSFPTEIRGKTFTFGSEWSTSGRLVPEYHIRQVFKTAPSNIFKKVGFSGNHSKTIALVQSGAYQLGAVSFKVWRNELQAGNIDPAKVSIIWETQPYPNYQWTIRGDVDQRWKAGFKNRVKAALLRMKDPMLLASFPRSGFIPASNSDYQPIAYVAKQLKLID